MGVGLGLGLGLVTHRSVQGGFSWDLFLTLTLTLTIQGGFIWDWADQGLLQTKADGSRRWAYGGDFHLTLTLTLTNPNPNPNPNPIEATSATSPMISSSASTVSCFPTARPTPRWRR